MNRFAEILQAVFHLFYPHICIGCGSDVLETENFLCLKCINELPHTHFALHENNPVEKDFWGRIQIHAGMSEFYFSKNSIVQNLIHELKYKGNRNVGIYLGNMMGKSLLNSNRFSEIDIIIPLPLFVSKEKKRGYNQSTLLCMGISEVIQKQVMESNVTREINTETQTKKHRTERWQNVAGTFKIKDPSQLENKHILLVDDVVTTGATLEACGSEILKIPNTSLSLATLATATR